MVRCQANLAAASSKRGVVSLLKPCCVQGANQRLKVFHKPLALIHCCQPNKLLLPNQQLLNYVLWVFSLNAFVYALILAGTIFAALNFSQ